ncbi:bifunctional epoxide hydrolase 2-like [Pyrus ussuriensis x Pyrus communis]|uniref:Bifunctional epoxide hydrolase 2-like n=1 Tax=Pyrus ussuriensis x Pyrus communis TaxID=2448454 RepID=A0A5N5FJD7_9ROSA|nr:bifunctional epoxide hydrolase 2-like [Pyrus ussuriensis x Pyrus communis]
MRVEVLSTTPGLNVIVFLHGLPEIWYSWWHHMIGLAHSGFRAIVPDYSGYGLSEPPPNPTRPPTATSSVFLVGKDFGARPTYLFALAYPQRVLGVITIGVPIKPPSPLKFDKNFPEAKAAFGCFDAETVVRNIYIFFSISEIPIAAENQEIMDLVDPSTSIPPWFTEEDLAAYGALYEKSGFQTALQIPYRALREESSLTNLIVKALALYIMEGKDYVNKFLGINYYIDRRVKKFVPNLEIQYMSKGLQFVQEQSPDEVNQLIITFLGKHV